MSERFLTRHEAADLMRISYGTLGNLGRRGPPFLKTARYRGKCLYRESDVVAYLQANAGHAAASSTVNGTSACTNGCGSTRAKGSSPKAHGDASKAASSTATKSRSPRRRKAAATL